MGSVHRRVLLRATVAAALGALAPASSSAASGQRPRSRPRGSEFVFARVRYDSGDWDYNPKVAANVLNSIVEYTNIPVYAEEKDYGCEWDYDWRNKRFQREDNTRFAVNIVVYAMTS